jgi:hypothetical protein
VPKKVRMRSGSRKKKAEKVSQVGEEEENNVCVRLWEEGWLFLALGGCTLRLDFPLSATFFI